MDPAHVPYAHQGLMNIRKRVDPGRYVPTQNFNNFNFFLHGETKKLNATCEIVVLYWLVLLEKNHACVCDCNC
jgi:hypothetical protein